MFEDWKQVQLGELVEKAFSGPSPTCEERNLQSDNEWGVLKTTSVTWSGWNAMAHKTLPESYWGLEDLEVKAGDVIVTKAGPRHRVGVVAYVDRTIPHLIVSGKMVGLRIKPDTCLPDILAGLLSTREPQTYLDHRTTGMAESQVNFANSALLKAPLRVPPKSEQEVMSSIGRHLDTQIQKTEALIAKLEKVKEGLLHDLLTRGIDENGQLRPSPQQAPELYKESPLGLIPREWDITLMRDLTTLVKSGLSRAIKDSDIGIPVLTSTNMVEDELSPENLKYWWRKDPQGANVNNYMLDDGDILLNFINSIEKIGKSCIYRDIGREAIYTTNIFRVKTSSLVSSEFLWRLLNSLHLKGWMKKITKPAINQASFTKPEFLAIPVAIPPVKEQSAIVLALENIDKNIRAKISDAEKLVDQKTGLMDDLLTGRVRVTPLLEQAQATTPA